MSFAFTQCLGVLFDLVPTVPDLEKRLGSWRIIGKPTEGEGEGGWAVSGPGLIIELTTGLIAVLDRVEQPWPDDPSAGSPGVRAAWGVGAFGPGVTPGALSRAADQPWGWDGRAAVAGHRGFVRLRTGYVDDANAPTDPPEERDGAYELTSLTDIAQDVLRLPGALAFFTPAGEALRSPAQVARALDRKVGVDPEPWELWVNLRGVALPPAEGAQWLALDTVGMGQLGLPDQEAIFTQGGESPDAVEILIRGACLELLKNARVGGAAKDGRGRRWKAATAVGVIAPPRPVVRWLPQESAPPSEAMLESLRPR